MTKELFRCAVVLILTLSEFMAGRSAAAEVEISQGQSTVSAEVDNPGPPVAPTIYVVGQRDLEQDCAMIDEARQKSP